MAAATACKEAIWLRQLLTDLGSQNNQPISLFVDNQSTIRLVHNPEFHKRTKHIDIKFHFIKEKVENLEIETKYVPTIEQLADLFTKALSKNRLKYLCSGLNILSARCVNGGSIGINGLHDPALFNER